MKKTLIFFLAILAVVLAKAAPISPDTAHKLALQFAIYNKGTRAKVPNKEKVATIDLRQVQTDLEHLYVFNCGDDDGFIVVSGDDVTDAILGYTDSGHFDTSDMPDNLRWWLQAYERQLATIGTEATSIRHAASNKQAVGQLLSTQWNQTEPYNSATPTSSGSIHYPTGCVATAMAQIVKYWSIDQTVKAIPAYTASTNNIYMKSLSGYRFDYAIMKDSYARSESGASVNEVAKLMLYCAQATQTDFDDGGSSATISARRFIEYFGFDADGYDVDRDDYSSTEWEDLIYNELAASRPVLYSGQSASGGHAFVCDGYDGNGYFHINWGWGGQGNGYFLLSVVNPYEKGIGGGSSNDGYSMEQAATIMLQPENGQSDMPQRPLVLTVRSLETLTTALRRSSATEDFEMTVNMSFYNLNSVSATFDYGIGIYRDGTLLKAIEGGATGVLGQNYGYSSLSRTIKFGNGLADGAYQLKAISRQKGTSQWNEDNGSNAHYIGINISGRSLTATNNTAKASLKVNSISCEGDLRATKLVTVRLNVTNTGTTNVYNIALLVDNQYVSGVGVAVDPGQTADVDIHFTPSTAGTKTIKITKNPETSIVLATTTVTIGERRDANLSMDNLSVANASADYKIAGTTMKVSVDVTNNDSQTFDDEIMAILFKQEAGQSYGYSQETIYRELTLQPRETQRVSFEFTDLEPNESYFVCIYTFKASANTWNNTFGTYLYDIVATAIGAPTVTATEATASTPVYDLRGTRVGTADGLRQLPRGVYVVGGKKVVVR